MARRSLAAAMKTLPLGLSPSQVSSLCLTLLSTWILTTNQAVAQPRIDTISSTRGKIRDNVVLQGSNFSPISGKNVVMFGGVRAPLTSASGTSLSVTVPPGVSYGPVSVTVDG